MSKTRIINGVEVPTGYTVFEAALKRVIEQGLNSFPNNEKRRVLSIKDKNGYPMAQRIAEAGYLFEDIDILNIKSRDGLEIYKYYENPYIIEKISDLIPEHHLNEDRITICDEQANYEFGKLGLGDAEIIQEWEKKIYWELEKAVYSCKVKDDVGGVVEYSVGFNVGSSNPVDYQMREYINSEAEAEQRSFMK